MTKNNVNLHHQTFESIKHLSADGSEYWLARDLSKVLDYSEYRHFQPVIEKAKEACKNSGQPVQDHFEDVLDMVEIGSGAKRAVQDVHLSRYACYLIVQNGDSSKTVIANGQTYFAMQTRRQELQDDAAFATLSEDERRVMLRNELSEHNKALVAAAKQSGVETSLDYAIFQDHGYRGLYGGRGAKDKRAAKQVALPPHGSLHDYVPFYFAPRSPMLGANHTKTIPNARPQEEILHLVTTAQSIANADIPFVFYDHHAVKEYSAPYNNLNDLCKIDWELFFEPPLLGGYSKIWNSTSMGKNPKWVKRMEVRMAEFLVHERLPWNLIKGIATINEEKAKEVEEILKHHQIDTQVKAKRDWYY
jgi:hypothetical protein